MKIGNTSPIESSQRRSRRKRTQKFRSSKIANLKSFVFIPLRLLAVVMKSGWFSSLLLVMFFFVYSIDFTILLNLLSAESNLSFTSTGGRLGENESLKDAARSVKEPIGLVFYFLSGMLMLVHFRKALAFTRKNYHIILMLTLPILGMYVSVIPEKVLYSVIQLLAGFFIALAYAISQQGKEAPYLNFCLLLLIPFSLIHIVSNVLLVVHDLDYLQFIDGSARYGGLGGNPNQLGLTATIGFWLAIYVLFDGKPRKMTKSLVLISLVMFVLSIVMSGSGTSKATIAVIFCVVLSVRLYTFAKGDSAKLIYLFSIVLLMLIGTGTYFVSNSIVDLQQNITGSLGKESNLTGRTDIWMIGIDAIAERPILGWGLDYHETVLGYDQYKIPGGILHYHNGFIDTLVSSGLIAFIFVLYNIGKYIFQFIRCFRIDRRSFGMLGPLVILLMHNVSEYSLMRPLSIGFQLYLCAFCLLAVSYYYHDRSSSNDALKTKAKPKKKKSTKRHIRFG